MYTRYKILLLILALHLQISGCSSDDPSAPLGEPSPLLDTVWTLESFHVLGGVNTASEMIGLTTIQLNSADDSLIGSTNCVVFFGTYSVVSNVLNIDVPTRDEGECSVDIDESIHLAEIALVNRALIEPLMYEITGNRLTLTTPINELLFFVDRGDAVPF